MRSSSTSTSAHHFTIIDFVAVALVLALSIRVVWNILRRVLASIILNHDLSPRVRTSIGIIIFTTLNMIPLAMLTPYGAERRTGH